MSAIAAGAAAASRPPVWRHRFGVKARSALAATVIVALAVAASSGAFVLLLERTLLEGIDSAVSDRVREVSASVADANPGGTAALDEAVRMAARQRTVVQVISPDGLVLASSSDIDGEEPLMAIRPADGEFARIDGPLPVDEEDTFRMVGMGVRGDSGTFTVVAAQSLEPVQDSRNAVISLLAVGYPVLLLIVGASTFWFVGRSLRPVEAIRTKVAAIGGRDLAERVPVSAADDEVARLAVTMNRMLDRLQAAQLSQRRFVADASHELRSPIATLKSIAEVNLAHPEQSEQAAVAEGFLAETTRLERLVNDLLLLARADERGLHPDRHDVDLDDLLAAERDRVRSISTLAVTAHFSAVRVIGERHQLTQVLRNLVDNALRHARSSVGLTLRREQDVAIIEVLDDGPGIADEDRERVFDRFVRLDESRERGGGGSGLGLAIVREIVQAHGGTVSVADSPVGARFRVTLPVAPPTEIRQRR